MKKILLLLSVFALSLFIIHPVEANSSTNQQLIIINKQSNKLAYFKNGNLVKTFSVATGKSRTLTPEGTFKIVNKIKNRPYYTKGIKGGDPKNPLGDRWLGLNARGTFGTTYAIHGNNNSSSIGKYVSAGCVRMHNNDVRWLFEQVPTNTKVIITHSKSSFDNIASANGYSLASKPNIKSINVSKTSPQLTDTTVNISGNVKGGNNRRYQFSIHDGKTWRVVRNYHSSNLYTWKPTKPGTYQLKVAVKNQNSSNAYDDFEVLTYKVVAPVSIKNVTFDQSSPTISNSRISVTANSINGVQPLFKFTVHDGNKWRTLQDYSPNKQFVWNPTKPGNYRIAVYTKENGIGGIRDAEVLNYQIINPVELEEIAVSKVSPQLIENEIKITAKASGGNVLHYLFEIEKEGTIVSRKAYSTTNVFKWKPSVSGDYKIYVYVRDRSKKYTQTQSIEYTIIENAVME